jgi:hypothetical protein
VMQKRSEAFGDREDPLPGGEMGQHVVREMGGELRHAARVAGGADAPALAGKGDQALVATVPTAGAGEPVGEDAATQVLDDWVERCGGGPSRSIRGRGGRTRWPGR